MKPNRFFNLLTTVLFLLLCGCVSFAQGPGGQMTQQQRELAGYIKSNYTKREVMVPMRDGVKLFTSIYEPKNTDQKYPIMFDRTPYSVGPYGPDRFRTLLGPDELFAREGSSSFIRMCAGVT